MGAVLHQCRWLISAGYGGQFLGAILFGAIAQKRGRLPVVRGLIIAMGALAVVCAAAGSYGELVAVRLVQGWPSAERCRRPSAMSIEVAPTATRGRFFGTFQFLMLAGFGLASLMSAWIVPHHGWRIMFALGAIPLLTVPFSVFSAGIATLAGCQRAADRIHAVTALPGQLGHGRTGRRGGQSRYRNNRAPVAELFAPAVRRKFSITAALWFITSLVSFGLLNWVPSLYVRIFNIPIDKALSYNSIVALSIFLLPVLLRQTIDRIGRRPPAIVGTAIGGAALLGILLVPQIGVAAGSWALPSSGRLAFQSVPWFCGPIPRKSIARGYVPWRLNLQQSGSWRINAHATAGGWGAPDNWIRRADLPDLRPRVVDGVAAVVAGHAGNGRT